MAVDADPSTEDIVDTSASRGMEEEFEVSTNITAVGTPYFGYQMSIEFDDGILAFVPVEPPMGIVYTGFGGMSSDAVALVQDDDSDGLPEIYGASARNTGTTTATGRANNVRFRCTAPGTTSLHLLTSSESATYHTSTVDYPFGDFITTTLQDASITCSSAAASPTPTAAAPAAVGGIADLSAAGISQAGPSDPSTVGPGSRATACAALTLAATGVVAMAAFAWYARRRRLG